MHLNASVTIEKKINQKTAHFCNHVTRLNFNRFWSKTNQKSENLAKTGRNCFIIGLKLIL